jgi:hypothetical protein
LALAELRGVDVGGIQLAVVSVRVEESGGDRAQVTRLN